MRMLLLPLLLACAGCKVIEQPSGLIPRWTTVWREVASNPRTLVENPDLCLREFFVIAVGRVAVSA